MPYRCTTAPHDVTDVIIAHKWISGQLVIPASVRSRVVYLSKIKETRMGFFMD